ncbi:hypothetical protein BH18ACI4_BH18ACI4_25990 [soil metagenome]
MEREAAKPRTREEETLALAEVAEDFKRIQLINNRMMGATMSAAAPDYGSIAGTTGEIRKRAIRIRKTYSYRMLTRRRRQRSLSTNEPRTRPR